MKTMLSTLVVLGFAANGFGAWNCTSPDSAMSDKGKLAVRFNPAERKAVVAILRADTIELTDPDANGGWYYLGNAENLTVKKSGDELTADNSHFHLKLFLGRPAKAKECGRSQKCYEGSVTGTLSIKVREIKNQKLFCVRGK